MKLRFVMLLFMCATGAVASQTSPFQEYPAEVFRGKIADIKAETLLAREHVTAIRKAMKGGPNFAGHYTVAEWGCGTACGVYVIVDDRTGKVYTPPEISKGVNLGVVGPEFRIDSTLMVVADCPAPEVYGLKDCERAFYQWTDSQLLLLKKEPVTTSDANH